MAEGRIGIYCPRCQRKVASWDGKSTMQLVSKCNKCKKLVVFTPRTNETAMKEVPTRATSSGKIFW